MCQYGIRIYEMNNDNWNSPKTELTLMLIGITLFVWVIFNYVEQLI